LRTIKYAAHSPGAPCYACFSSVWNLITDYKGALWLPYCLKKIFALRPAKSCLESEVYPHQAAEGAAGDAGQKLAGKHNEGNRLLGELEAKAD
jgi:hypothetical protein